MAGAGFFYSGYGSNTYCFICDGGLCEWKPNDNPYTDHRDNYPNCDYIQSENFLRAESNYLRSKMVNTRRTEIGTTDLQTTAAQALKKYGYSDKKILEAMESISISDPVNSHDITTIMTYINENSTDKEATDSNKEATASCKAQVVVSR